MFASVANAVMIAKRLRSNLGSLRNLTSGGGHGGVHGGDKGDKATWSEDDNEVECKDNPEETSCEDDENLAIFDCPHRCCDSLGSLKGSPCSWI